MRKGEPTIIGVLHEEVSQNLLHIMTQLQNVPPLEAVGGENWWTRLGEIERLYESAKEEALRAVPEEIDARLRSIREQRDALIPTGMRGEATRGST